MERLEHSLHGGPPIQSNFCFFRAQGGHFGLLGLLGSVVGDGIQILRSGTSDSGSEMGGRFLLWRYDDLISIPEA